ncbi:hypothetical protein FNU77_00190 (plasmid) [Prescottella equi]|uniref:Uncharacterized protein n=1 Tax=Rhodococcus hoagii TaxID=43767 RepID=B4F337_RHOHA|nr:hypothetical protein [Prescottella equi]ARX59559.1 hypothetical protein pVAPB1475_0300 [Prescottella equi]ARX60519.1 hypothetical protein pVAPB1413_0300 [Prescottella equi]ARX60624.1 hypothetical protein pVAPB1533_0300 [Prescottella equi]QDP08247.1 hypothetical protein FNU77_00190 [Prescottella equi]CAQ30308.1 hypothetical protein pVAPB_0300 [Prescottella equi]
MTDGLSQLNSRRQAGRRVPPSQNPVRVNPAAATNPDAAATAPGPTPQPAPTPQAAAVPQPAPAPVQAKRAAPKPSATTPAPPAEDPLVSATVYLSTSNDEFLEDVKRAGRRNQPKIDANRSAVVRLALTRLAEQMSPEQVAQELSARAGRLPGTTGRTRL